jgi:hypothetical protein
MRTWPASSDTSWPDRAKRATGGVHPEDEEDRLPDAELGPLAREVAALEPPASELATEAAEVLGAVPEEEGSPPPLDGSSWEVAADAPDEDGRPLDDVAAPDDADPDDAGPDDVVPDDGETEDDDGRRDVEDPPAPLEEAGPVTAEDGGTELEVPASPGPRQRPCRQVSPPLHRPLGQQGLPSSPSPFLPAVSHTCVSRSQ